MNAEPGKDVDATGAAFHPSGHPGASVDLDLLADYSCGVLDHAHSEMVAARIATDPAWAAAYRQLEEADAAVQSDLAALRTPLLTMPSDVAARIDAALAAAAPTSVPTVCPTPMSVPPVAVPPVSPAPAAPISLAARRRRMRVAAVAAAAAAVVAIAGVAVGVVVNQSAGDRSTTASQPGAAREDDNVAGQPRPTEAPTRPSAQSEQKEEEPPAKANPLIRRSGRNYTAATLPRVLESPSATPTPSPSLGRSPRAAPAPAPLPRELKRLDQQDERMRCLRAVRQRYGAYPTLVDYARYEGDAALIMVLPPERGSSRPRILVVGPNCGVSGSDARYLHK